MTRFTLTLAALLAIQIGAGAQTPELPSWMVGCWSGEVRGRSIHERWFASGGGSLVAVSTTVAAGADREFEFVRIVRQGERLAYVAQPGGRPPTTFTATRVGAADVVFENPQHDFPKRVGYQRSGDALLAWIDGGDGSGPRQEFPLRRTTCER
jgi:hypothetical protein